MAQRRFQDSLSRRDFTWPEVPGKHLFLPYLSLLKQSLHRLYSPSLCPI